jgi:hypothetical protein
MLIRTDRFEFEANGGGVFLRLGTWERFSDSTGQGLSTGWCRTSRP